MVSIEHEHAILYKDYISIKGDLASKRTVITTGKKKSTSGTKSAARPRQSKKAPQLNSKIQMTAEIPDGKKSEGIVNEESIPENSDYSYFETVQLSIDKTKYYARPIASKEELADIKRKMDDDVKTVKEIMAQLEAYLRGKVDQIGINDKQFEITIPIEYMSLKFTTILAVHPQWIFIKCKLMDLEDVPEKARHELYEHILVANFELNAVFYSIDPDITGIWVENDIPVPGLDLSPNSSFDIKFNAIIFGIRFFVDSIALPLNQEMKSTFENSGMYT